MAFAHPAAGRSGGDQIRLRLSSTFEGADASAAMGDMLAQFATAVPGQSRTIEPAEWAAKMHELDVRRVAVIEAVVNPRTLLPAEAMTRSTVSVSDGKETTERVEEHAWTFVWDHAQQ